MLYWYLGRLCFSHIVLCTINFMSIQQDCPTIHEHSISLIHRNQHRKWVLTTIACPPTKDPAEVIPWETGKKA